MMAPAGGFSPSGSSGGIGVSVQVLCATRVTGSGRTNVSSLRGVPASCRSGGNVVEDPDRSAVSGDNQVTVLDTRSRIDVCGRLICKEDQ